MLRVEGVRAGYGDLTVLWDVGLHVGDSELVALVGANAAGKTTLLRCVAGLHRPLLAGSVEFQGVRTERAPAHEIARLGVALVSERTVFPDLTVMENLGLGKLALGRRNAPPALLERVFELFPDLEVRRRQVAGSLSGGQRQMLAFGRALMGAPALLLLDEPSTGIAPKVVQRIFDAIRALNKDGMAILLVDQYVQDAVRIADRAYVLERGTIVAENTSQALLDDPTLRRAYLGV